MIVSDDVAVGREQNKMVGRRGLAGTAFIHKILGSASATSPDVDLKSLSDLGHAINKNLVTLEQVWIVLQFREIGRRN